MFNHRYHSHHLHNYLNLVYYKACFMCGILPPLFIFSVLQTNILDLKYKQTIICIIQNTWIVVVNLLLSSINTSFDWIGRLHIFYSLVCISCQTGAIKDTLMTGQAKSTGTLLIPFILADNALDLPLWLFQPMTLYNLLIFCFFCAPKWDMKAVLN